MMTEDPDKTRAENLQAEASPSQMWDQQGLPFHWSLLWRCLQIIWLHFLFLSNNYSSPEFATSKSKVFSNVAYQNRDCCLSETGSDKWHGFTGLLSCLLSSMVNQNVCRCSGIWVSKLILQIRVPVKCDHLNDPRNVMQRGEEMGNLW